MSAAELSRMAGYSPSYMTKVEKGHIEPSFYAVAKVLAILDATDAEILWIVRENI